MDSVLHVRRVKVKTLKYIFKVLSPHSLQALATLQAYCSRTVVGSLFQITGRAELKAGLPCLVGVHGTRNRGRVDECSDIDEPES